MRRSAKKRSAVARVRALAHSEYLNLHGGGGLVGGGKDLDGAEQVARAKPRFGTTGREVPERPDGPRGSRRRLSIPAA